MKFAYSVILLLCCASSQLTAQSVFAPAGSEWYHTIDGAGVFHSYYAGDTIVAGISCRKVIQKAEKYAYIPYILDDLPTLYLYNTADTVFAYNRSFGRFTPLYVFNVSAGDTVTLPYPDPAPQGSPVSVGDSFFRFVVDSVRMVHYDTTLLKTVYSRALVTPYPGGTYYYGKQDSVCSYAERLGSLKHGLIPICIGCATPLSMSIVFPDELRCYKDPSLSVHLVSGLCDVPPPTHVQEVSANGDLLCYPNPSRDLLTVSYSGASSDFRMQVVDVAGRTLAIKANVTGTTLSLDISGLANGVYVLSLIDHNGIAERQRFVVLH